MNPRYRLRSTSLLAPEQLSNTTPNEESLNGKANDVRSLDAACEKFRVGGESRGPETQQVFNPAVALRAVRRRASTIYTMHPAVARALVS